MLIFATAGEADRQTKRFTKFTVRKSCQTDVDGTASEGTWSTKCKQPQDTDDFT